VIDDEVQVGKVPGRALEVMGMPVLLDPALERQSFVEADVLARKPSWPGLPRRASAR
jgi:hypothetical protein